MADTTILNADIGVTWFANNRCKYLEWIGGTNDNYTMNELYSAMQTLQDETATIDDGTCFSAETPVEYTIGKIDQGDNDPWFVQFDLMEHITGGALKSSGWTRVTDTNTGIIVVPGTNVNMVAGDCGQNITGATTGAGTLLEVIVTGGTYDYLVIRPDGSASANDFVTVSQTLTEAGTSHTFTQWANANSTTGDQVWANVYSIGTIESSAHLYIYQGQALTTDVRSRVCSWNSATLDWYGNGHVDTVVALKDIEQTTWSVVDDGYLNVYARKGGDLYASFEVANSTTSGGRNPVPLQTAVDLDQGHGTKKISFTGAVAGGPFTDGEIISDGTTLGRGILDLTNSTVTSGGELVYFPISTAAIGGGLTAMATGNTVTGASSSASVTTNGNPQDAGPADSTWFTNSGNPPSISFTSVLADIDNDSTDEYYGISIDCNQNPLTEVYQWSKLVCQYGAGDAETIELAEADIFGEEYVGGTAYITYTGGATPDNIVEGESVTQQTSGATGVVLSHDTANDVVLLRSTRGTFGAYTIDADDDGSTWTTVTAVNFAAKTAAPLGSFAGGTFFGARGVLVSDYLSADENSFILTDITGGTYERPTTITLAITNLVGSTTLTSNEDDRVSMFRLTGSGGDIDKAEYDVTGTPAAGDATLAINGSITDDTAGSTAGGTLVVVQNPGSSTAIEFPIRFSSWASGTFTLANMAQFVTTGTNNATRVEYSTGGFNANVKRGDIVYNSTRSASGYVKTVDSDTILTLESPGITGNITGDSVEINCVPAALDSGDDVYVPFIDKIAEASSESASIIYLAQIYYRVKVRNTRNTTTKIKPYSSDGNTSGDAVSVQITRAEDTIIT